MTDRWTVEGRDGAGRSRVSEHESWLAAHTHARTLLAAGQHARMTWRPADDPGTAITFDVAAPTLLNALEMRFLPSRALPGRSIAEALGVQLGSIHDALEPLVAAGLLEIHDRAGGAERWDLTARAPTLERLKERARESEIHLEVSLVVPPVPSPESA
jgi:hypothetical protein